MTRRLASIVAALRDRLRRAIKSAGGGPEWLRRCVRSRSTARGRVEVSVWDVDRLRAEFDDWDDLPKREKARCVRELKTGADPDEFDETTNAFNDDWHEYLVDRLDRSQDPATVQCTHFAVGTDGSPASSSDDGLGNEVYRTTVADTTDDSRELLVQCFLDSGEANGNTLREMGLFTDVAGGSNELQLNRARISEVAKDDSKTVSIDVTLEFRSA